MWQLVDNPPLSTHQNVEGVINCHVKEEDTTQPNENISVSTQLTVKVTKDKESEFSEKFHIVFPTIRGQCLNTRDFKLVKDKLIAEIENSLNPTEVIDNFLDSYADIINSSQTKQLGEIINSG